MTATSVTSASLDPVSLLVCLDRNARTAEAIHEAGYFAVNILRDSQRDVCRRFARPGGDHFEGLAVDEGPAGVPLLPGCLAHVVCRLSDVLAAGDHDIFLGVPEHIAINPEGRPLVCYLGGLQALTGAPERRRDSPSSRSSDA